MRNPILKSLFCIALFFVSIVSFAGQADVQYRQNIVGTWAMGESFEVDYHVIGTAELVYESNSLLTFNLKANGVVVASAYGNWRIQDGKLYAVFYSENSLISGLNLGMADGIEEFEIIKSMSYSEISLVDPDDGEIEVLNRIR